MADQYRALSINDLPTHLIIEIFNSNKLSVYDLISLELTSTIFRSLVEFATCQMCASHPIYAKMSSSDKNDLFNRCGENWKLVLRFLQSVEQSFDLVETSLGKMKVTAGKYHTLLIGDSSVYSCGSSICGVLGHGPETTQCVSFTRVNISPSSAPVIHVSASHNHAAFITDSGEVYTSGDNSSFCCGHKDTGRPIFRPRLVDELKGIPCKQVATGHSFTMFLTRQGQVYTCGTNTYGQLGHGDTIDKPTPTLVQALEGSVIQIAAGPNYALAITNDGTVYSFGSGSNFCLGHGEQHNEHQPRAIQKLKRNGVHVVRVSAGDEHAVALDSSGRVHTWGKGYCGALGHGDEIDKTTPEPLISLDDHLAVQICASKRKTFVLLDTGSVYGFGWTGFGSLGFPDLGPSEKVMRPRMLLSLKAHRISQISTGLYHTVVVTNKGKILGFGDNERAQLGHDTLRGCPEPTETFIQDETKEDLDYNPV